MKRNPHIIVQQVCPCARTKDGKYSVLSAIVRHKGLIARFCVEHPTKRHARWAQHLICTTKNHTRLRVFDELKALIEEGGRGGGRKGECTMKLTRRKALAIYNKREQNLMGITGAIHPYEVVEDETETPMDQSP